MQEKEEAKLNIQQLDDHCPPIVNCRAGLNGAGLRGRLTDEEIEKVKRLSMVQDIRKQLAIFQHCDCSKKSNESNTTIAYYPKEAPSVTEEINPIIIVQAMCLNNRCEHNSDSPTKK